MFKTYEILKKTKKEIKFAWGLKLQQEVNIEGLKRAVFFREPKSQHLKT